MSHLESLSRCMIESDPESRTRAKWLRRKSLALSLAIEAGILAALLIVPLLASSVLPPVFMVTPAPPYLGVTRVIRRNSTRAAPHAVSLIFESGAERPAIRRATERFGAAPPMIGEQVGPGDPVPSALEGDGNGTAINLAPPVVATAKPLRQSEGVMAARLIRRVQPQYPRIAWLMRLAGTVRLRAIVGTDGSVQQLEVLSGNPILARAALEAVQQWRYEPTRLDGQPVEVETNITVTFVLN